jgi:hypothetical protein
MGLSIKKLIKLISYKQYKSIRLYTINDIYIFIEIMSLITSQIYMIYIPSKYSFNKLEDIQNNYDITVFNIENESELNEIIKTYSSDNHNENIIRNMYINVDNLQSDLQYNNGNKDSEFKNKLTNGYEQQITLSSVDDNDMIAVKCICRQLERLKYSVRNVRYKLMIIYKSYICVIHSSENIDCFAISNFGRSIDNNMRLLITMDLDLFYEKIETLDNDLFQVNNGIIEILDRNHMSNSQIIKNILNKNMDITSISNGLLDKKNTVRSYIYKLRDLFKILLDKEEYINKQIIELTNKSSKNLDNINLDLKLSQEAFKFKKDLESIMKYKTEINEHLYDLQLKEINMSLIIDKVLFDNAIMLDKIYRNLFWLQEL